MDIKEIALKVADSLRNKVDGISHMQSNQGLVSFAEALIAEVQNQNEPVAYRWKERERWLSWYVDWTWHDKAKSLGFPIEYAYTFPPSVEAIENKVAEACALQVATETKFHWLDAARVAKEIRSGEWRKHMKGD